MSQSGDDPSSSSPPFSTPPNEIYLAEKTITEGGIAKNISSTEETITTSSGAKINSLEEEPMTEKIIKTKEDNIETCTEGDNKLDESMNKNLASLDQQTPLEDKFKSFSEEDIDEELNEDMNHEEEKSKILQISQQQDDSPLPKTNNELLIDVSSQRMLRSSASPVIFFSPNNTKMPETSLEEGLNDSETLKSSNTLLITTTTSNIPCMKMSASIADLLPSRFPTEENEKKNKRGSKLETLAARQAKMVYSATFNNTFPNSSENIGKEKKMISQKPLEGASSGAHNNRGKNNTKNNIPAKVNTNRRTSLSKIFTNFRLQLEKTKTSFRTSSSADELKKTLITSNKRNYIPITRSFTTSLASPSTSSGSLDNYLRRRKNKSFLKKSVGKEEMDKQQYYTTTEDFTACNSEQLTILSGQRIEILTTNCNNSDEDNNNEFIKIAVLDKFGQRENEGLVPKRLLMPLDGSDQPMASTSHAHDETASTPSSSNKRTSIRRFFTSSSQKGESKQQRSSPSGTVIRPKSATSTTTNSDFTTTNCIDQNKNNNNNKILSPSTKINNNKTQQEIPSANHNDLLDLPPPMDQLGVGDKENGEHENELNPSENNTTTEAIAETSNSAPSPPQMSAEETCRLKRSYVLQELVETERAYVVDLASIVDGYIGTLKEMELSDEDREKVKIIFANIEQILDFHKSVFCKEIEKSLEDYEAAGNAFIKYERRLHTFYVKYCQNKPKSDFLVSQDNFEQLLFDVKDRLGHKVSINDLLIKPVQRITKYQLMLSDILKYTHRANDRAEVLERAHDVMRVVPKACDDMMQVGRLQGFQGNLTAQGRLIFQGTLIISDGNIIQPFKGKERRVFLFEQSVIIAECIPPRKEYGNPLYNFKNQIMVNKMILEENVVDEPLRFVLQSNDPNQPATFVAQSQSIEDKEQWLIKLSAQLDQQKTFLAALVDPKRYLANSMGSMNISGKKDSSGSLGTPTSPGVSSTIGNITIPTSGLGGGSTASGAISPTKPRATQQKSSGSKLFGFGKQKT